MNKASRSHKNPPLFPPLPGELQTQVRLFEGVANIPYYEAYCVLARALGKSAESFSASVRAELPAIVTHWLQSVNESPILLGADEASCWRCILSEYARERAGGPRASGSHGQIPFTIDFSSLQFAPTQKPSFRFIDLFAGIGGFRLALQAHGGKCVFSSEWDEHAQQTYARNYGEFPFGDITHFTEPREGWDEGFLSAVPSHEILAGGFPCQAFSKAGRQLGFNDARGTLFFDILKIARRLEPEVLFLENVKRLRSHEGGRTFKLIANSLREIGYKVYAKVLRAFDFGVPQNRERIFIVAFKSPIHFEFPDPPEKRIYDNVGSILQAEVEDHYTISDRLYAGHLRRKREHRAKGNGFGFSVFTKESLYTNTVSARYWKDGSEILIDQGRKNPRMLTPRECARLQGYPDHFIPHESRKHAYKQFGNSVAVPVVSAIAESIVKWRKKGLPARDFSDPFKAVIE